MQKTLAMICQIHHFRQIKECTSQVTIERSQKYYEVGYKQGKDDVNARGEFVGKFGKVKEEQEPTLIVDSRALHCGTWKNSQLC